MEGDRTSETARGADRGASVTAWRTTRKEHAETAFSGKGAAEYGGRWNPKRVPAVYLSSSQALSVLEVLTQVRGPGDLAGYVVIPATFDAADVSVPDALPADWRALPAPRSTQDVGAAWAAGEASLVLRVPSVVLPAEPNYVLNPTHPRAGAVVYGDPEPLEVDPRLFAS